ncbi:MAG: adenylyltransferase/cytidyltransferase family protein [Candidatus Peribacteraceae bacterium]|jgi:FAD synthetase|nr:adenylyltransferase/cytidyltransferase family protein [Candidatus Peribacteraceae bacterium]
MKVITFGTFDHIHPGHLEYLSFAQTKGDLFIVVARDANVEHIKGRSPDQSESKRVEALEDAFPNATVILGDSDDYLKPVRDIQPDLMMMGYDQKLPPGISESDISCDIERADAHNPEENKSSLRRENV